MTNEIKASHILIAWDGAEGAEELDEPRTKEEALAEIKDILSQYEEGAEFALLAEMYSDCPSAEDEGNLGTFGRGMMVPEFEDAAFALKPGDVSEPVETPFGYHLIFRWE